MFSVFTMSCYTLSSVREHPKRGAWRCVRGGAGRAGDTPRRWRRAHSAAARRPRQLHRWPPRSLRPASRQWTFRNFKLNVETLTVQWRGRARRGAHQTETLKLRLGLHLAQFVNGLSKWEATRAVGAARRELGRVAPHNTYATSVQWWFP